MKASGRLALLGALLLPLLVAPLWVCAATPAAATPLTQEQVLATLTLPRASGSVRFAVIGDNGTGGREQFEVAAQMAAFHGGFPFDFVIMLGDNIYGADTPADMKAKFETPYKPLLDAGVTFHASLGNHDSPNQRFYKLFNMGGERYHTFRAPKGGDVRFFALDTDYVDKPQLDWLENELAHSGSAWKIAYFHHPLYSSGKFHGASLETRAVLEPLFVQHGVQVVFSGHDHVYERIKPQKGGIFYWVSGAAGQLRKGDVGPSSITAKSFDTDNHFMMVEIVGDDLYFQAVSRTGVSVDSGVIHRKDAPAPSPSPTTSALPEITPPPGPGSTPSPAPSPLPSQAPASMATPSSGGVLNGEGRPAAPCPLPTPTPR